MSGGNWDVEPSKLGGFGNAVSALDAARVLQFVAGLTTFTPLQRLACDVTGDGTVSALDAQRILQFSAGIITQFPVAAGVRRSDWLVLPARPGQQIVLPSVSGGACQQGNIVLQGLNTSVSNQNFSAILFGDCTGNWTPSGGASVHWAPLCRGRPRGDRARRCAAPGTRSSGPPAHLRAGAGALERPRPQDRLRCQRAHLPLGDPARRGRRCADRRQQRATRYDRRQPREREADQPHERRRAGARVRPSPASPPVRAPSSWAPWSTSTSASVVNRHRSLIRRAPRPRRLEQASAQSPARHCRIRLRIATLALTRAGSRGYSLDSDKPDALQGGGSVFGECPARRAQSTSSEETGNGVLDSSRS